MGKKVKIFLTSMLGILLVLILIALIFLMSIRGEFARYLDEKYSEISFTVGFTRVDFIYGEFYAKATCLDDYTNFPITKSFKTKEIHEDYVQYKSKDQYNSRIKEIFYGSWIENKIKSVTGGGKIPFENGGTYTQINIHLTDEEEHISDIEKVLHLLKENNISAERIILSYEKDKHVYEIRLSSDNYSLTEKEIEAKVERIK